MIYYRKCKMELNFDKIFKIAIISQKFSGTYPYTKRDKKWATHFILMHGELTIICMLFIYNIIEFDLKAADYSQMCRNMCLSFVYMVITLLYINMLYYQSKLKMLIETMKAEYELAKTMSEEEQNVILEYAKKGRWLCRAWAILTTCGMAQFFLKSIVCTIYSAIQGNFRIVQYYEVICPEVIERHRNNPVIFITLYFCTFFYSLYTSALYTSVLPLGPIFLLHGCAKLEIVRLNIKNLFDNDDYVVQERLKKTVLQMQDIYCYSHEINECFQILYEFLLKATSLVLPITIFAVIQALGRGQFIPEFFAFIFGAFMVGTTPCYYSNMLMEKSEDVRMTLYSCGWETRFDLNTRKCIILMLCRALRPVSIRTIFRSVSLTTLTDVFQQAYALFNLLNAVWN
ncbi:olfactory receptor 33 [Bombyx mori]|uniref:Odorant receptor n=1 Tax=Bombyx mori TaxID=7091 RepID=A7E3H4_BOMMO|nr:olfactory receptor 33 [Bombyx mori]DAA05989.1 TPA_exp: odorant receptor 33 [Bombyx mori]